jgi:hypothetical protein
LSTKEDVMIRFRTAAAVTALALVAAPVAFAQSGQAPADPTMQGQASQAPQAPQAPMNDQAAPAPTATAADSAGVNTGAIVYQSSPTPADQAYTLKAGDPTVVSNAPVPDTKANRARYGRPLSMTGQRTAPAGN